jgi:hypothetical protein
MYPGWRGPVLWTRRIASQSIFSGKSFFYATGYEKRQMDPNPEWKKVGKLWGKKINSSFKGLISYHTKWKEIKIRRVKFYKWRK